MNGEDYCGGWGGGASCTKVQARAIFAACDYVISSSLCSSLRLTSAASSSTFVPTSTLILCSVYMRIVSSISFASPVVKSVEDENFVRREAHFSFTTREEAFRAMAADSVFDDWRLIRVMMSERDGFGVEGGGEGGAESSRKVGLESISLSNSICDERSESRNRFG